ncbi:MAG TPA: hypothetical protein VMU08_02170 [Rhizomicrobium sp.]|nr:hypothetical protein [Rhizomicrobium sp.]
MAEVAESDPRAPARESPLGALAMIVVGLLIFVPSGLCTAFMGGGALLDVFSHPENAGDSLPWVLLVLVVGGPFVFGGGTMIRYGIRWLRDR